jgi:hypothetical protein
MWVQEYNVRFLSGPVDAPPIMEMIEERSAVQFALQQLKQKEIKAREMRNTLNSTHALYKSAEASSLGNMVTGTRHTSSRDSTPNGKEKEQVLKGKDGKHFKNAEGAYQSVASRMANADPENAEIINSAFKRVMNNDLGNGAEERPGKSQRGGKGGKGKKGGKGGKGKGKPADAKSRKGEKMEAGSKASDVTLTDKDISFKGGKTYLLAKGGETIQSKLGLDEGDEVCPAFLFSNEWYPFNIEHCPCANEALHKAADRDNKKHCHNIRDHQRDELKAYFRQP